MDKQDPFNHSGHYFSRFSTSSLPVKALNFSLNHILDKETDQQLVQALITDSNRDN